MYKRRMYCMVVACLGPHASGGDVLDQLRLHRIGILVVLEPGDNENADLQIELKFQNKKRCKADMYIKTNSAPSGSKGGQRKTDRVWTA